MARGVLGAVLEVGQELFCICERCFGRKKQITLSQDQVNGRLNLGQCLIHEVWLLSLVLISGQRKQFVIDQ